MSIIISNVSNNETFAALVQKVNQLSDIFTSNVVTADTTTAGSATVGNVNLNGKLAANVLATKMLQGGDLLNSANLVIVSNTAITMNNIDVMKVTYDTAAANIQYAIVANNMTLNSDKLQFAVANMVFDGANVHLNSYLYVDNNMYANGTMFIKNMMTANGGANVHANLTVTGNTSITGKVAVTGNTDLTGSLTVSANAAITGNLTANWAGLTTANVTTLGANTLTVRLDASVGNNFVVGNNVTVSNGSISVGNATVNTVISSTTAYATTIRANNNLYVGNSTVNTAITPTVINAANVVIANTLTVGENVVVTLNMQANSANAVVMTANTLSIANNSSFGGNILVTGNVSSGNVASFKTMAANALTANVFTVNTSVTVGNSTVNTAITTTQITVANLVANNITVNNLSVPLAINTTNDVNANNVIAVNSVTGNNLSATVNVSTAGITVTANAVIANAYITNANTRTSWTNTAVANSFTATTANVVTFRSSNSISANLINSNVVTANIIYVSSVATDAINTTSLYTFRGPFHQGPASFKNMIDNGEFNIKNRSQYIAGYGSGIGFWPCDRWRLYISDTGSYGSYGFYTGWTGNGSAIGHGGGGGIMNTGATTVMTQNMLGITSWGGFTKYNGGSARPYTGLVYLDQMLPFDRAYSMAGESAILSFAVNASTYYRAGVTRVRVYTGSGTVDLGSNLDWNVNPVGYWRDGTKLLDADVSTQAAPGGGWRRVITAPMAIPSGTTQIMVRFMFDYNGNAADDASDADGSMIKISQVQLEQVDSAYTGSTGYAAGGQSYGYFERKPLVVEDLSCKRFYQSSYIGGYNKWGLDASGLLTNVDGAEAVRLIAASTSLNHNRRFEPTMLQKPNVRWWSQKAGDLNKIWNQSSNADITVTGTATNDPTWTNRLGAPTFASTGSANQLILGHWEASAEYAGATSIYSWA